MRRWLALGFVVLWCWGCSGGPDCGLNPSDLDEQCRSPDTGSTPDAGADAGTAMGNDGGGSNDAGDALDGSTNTDVGHPLGAVLVMDPGTIRVVQGFMRCVDLSVRHQDGTLLTLLPAEHQVQLSGPGAAMAALGEPGDCPRPEQFAIVASEAGQAELIFNADGLTFAAGIDVIAAEIRAEVSGALGNTVAVNRPALIQGPLFRVRAYVADRLVLEGEPVPRLIGIEPEDASILAIEAAGVRDYRFTGLEAGSTAVRPTYAGTTDSFVPESITTRVVDRASLLLVRTRLFEASTWTPPRPEDLTMGACFRVVLEGRFEADGIFFAGELPGAIFTLEGFTEGPVGRVCIESPGLLTAAGCDSGMCHTIEFLVPPAEIVSVRMVPSSPPPFVEKSPFRVCPPLDVFIDFADNTTIDVTQSRVYELLMVVPGQGSEGDDVWGEFRDSATGDLDLEAGYRCVSNGTRSPGTTVPCVFQASVGLAETEQVYDVTF